MTDDLDEMTACRLLLLDMGYVPGEPVDLDEPSEVF